MKTWSLKRPRDWCYARIVSEILIRRCWCVTYHYPALFCLYQPHSHIHHMSDVQKRIARRSYTIFEECGQISLLSWNNPFKTPYPVIIIAPIYLCVHLQKYSFACGTSLTELFLCLEGYNRHLKNWIVFNWRETHAPWIFQILVYLKYS